MSEPNERDKAWEIAESCELGHDPLCTTRAIADLAQKIRAYGEEIQAETIKAMESKLCDEAIEERVLKLQERITRLKDVKERAERAEAKLKDAERERDEYKRDLAMIQSRLENSEKHQDGAIRRACNAEARVKELEERLRELPDKMRSAAASESTGFGSNGSAWIAIEWAAEWLRRQVI